MTPFYGQNDRPLGDVVPDWLLGGNRKRRVLAALAEPDRSEGWRPSDLAAELRCGRTTVFEIVRALRALEVILEDAQGYVRLDPGTDLGDALVKFVQAIEAFADETVDRPPRSRSITPHAAQASD